MIFKLLNDKSEYDALALSVLDEFGSVDDWLEFFDIWKYTGDENYDDITDWDEFLHNELENNSFDIEYSPSNSEYPVVLAYSFDGAYDRMGNTKLQLWEWVSLDELENNL